MKYKPYTPEWTRYRALEDAIYDYLQDPETSPEEVCEDIRDVIETWIEMKRKEQDAIRLRPHPYELHMYYDA